MKLIVGINDHQKLLKEFLLGKNISKKTLKRLKRYGDILVNGKHQSVRYVLSQGDEVTLIFPKETSTMLPYPLKLNIVYEDDYYLVVDKPVGLPSIPTARYPDKTLANALIYYYNTCQIEATVHLVNRLDKDTQGLMLVAKDSYSHYLLSRDIKQVKRIYHCLVTGKLEGRGTIDASIAVSHDSIKRYISPHGKKAITHYRLLKYENNQSLVECCLETGRTHQIRVHLSSINHPLVNDSLYGNQGTGLYYLDSVELSFVHPYTKELIEIKKTVL